MSHQLRRIQAFSAFVIVLGLMTGYGMDLHAEEGSGCWRICSTFCPTNVRDYCENIANCKVEEEAQCGDCDCQVMEYTFPKWISCTGELPSGCDGGAE